MTEQHPHPVGYQPGEDPVMDEIWKAFDSINPGVIPRDVREFLVGFWRGHIMRHCAAARVVERERILTWFALRSPLLVEAYRDRELSREPPTGDNT